MLEQLTDTARNRMRASGHPDLVSDEAENAAIHAADMAADGVFDASAPILDASEGPLSEQRQREMMQIFGLGVDILKLKYLRTQLKDCTKVILF